MRKNRFLIAGTVGPIVTIAAIFVDIYLSPWFSWSRNALSDLGVHPYSYIFNGSLIFEAAMNAIFVFVLHRIIRAKGASMSLLFAAGISLGLVGIFNENSPDDLHLVFALIYFLLFPVAIIFFILRNKFFSGRIQTVSVILAVVALIAILVGIMQVFSVIKISDVGLAVTETIEAVLLGTWSVLISMVSYFRPAIPQH